MKIKVIKKIDAILDQLYQFSIAKYCCKSILPYRCLHYPNGSIIDSAH